jgi:Putative bacterial sensory transduction regulator
VEIDHRVEMGVSMFRKALIAAAVGVATLSLASTANAQTVTASNPSSVATALQNMGYKAELTKDDSGDPMIRSASSGTSFIVFFFGCTKNVDCRTLQLFAGFSDPKNASLNTMNDWNSKHRFARGYVSDKGAARLEMDIDLDDGGLSKMLFEDNIEFWVEILGQFEKIVTTK